MKWSAKQNRIFCLLMASVLALPLSIGSLTGLFLWTSPLLMFKTLVAGNAISFFSLLGAAALILVILRPRWYCRWLCPPGVLCDAASRKSRRNKARKIPRLGALLAAMILASALIGVPLLGLLDPIAVFHVFFDSFRETSILLILLKAAGLILIVGINFFTADIWCGKLCPLGGLQDIITDSRKSFLYKKTQKKSLNTGRRLALGMLAGFGIGLLFRKVSATGTDEIRPPAVLPIDQFQATCIRCGNCSRACPTEIIQTSFDPANLTGLLTPHVSFTSGYCLPDCICCGAVCPSGAIQRFSEEQKKNLVMGIASIHREDCLLTAQKECDRCRYYCAYDAVSIQISKIDFSAWPVILEDRCVGCGACVVACPVNVITVKPKEVSR
jgi:ferredoxin